MDKLDREYVWECDYGNRKELKKALKKLLEEQDSSSLQMIALCTNSNPYCLELYVVISYDIPKEGHIKKMMEMFETLGSKYRPDITYMELFDEMKNRRFNICTLDEYLVDYTFESNTYFAIPEKSVFEEQGYRIERLGERQRVFLSHSFQNKKDIEELIPFLNSKNLPVWYAPIDIEYGDSIINKVEEGMEKSVCVIFWITKEYLNSRWCKKEMSSFLNRQISRNNILILPIVENDILEQDIPPFISELKYLRISRPINFELVAREIMPVLTKYYCKQK